VLAPLEVFLGRVSRADERDVVASEGPERQREHDREDEQRRVEDRTCSGSRLGLGLGSGLGLGLGLGLGSGRGLELELGVVVG